MTPVALGSAAVVVPVVALLAWAAGADAWRDLIAFPAGDFRLVRSEAWPGLLPDLSYARAWLADPANLAAVRDTGVHGSRWILANAPQVGFLAGLAFVTRRWRSLSPERRMVAVAALVALPLHWAAAHVQQNTHMTTMALLAFLLGVILWGTTTAADRGWRGLAVALLAFWVPGLAVRPAMEASLPLWVWSGWGTLDLPVARGVFVAPNSRDSYAPVAAFVHRNVPPGEAIHAGVARNDGIVVSNARFYYLLDRPCATRYHELHPGITDVAEVQREMIDDIERRGVRCIVVWHFGGRDRAPVGVEKLVAKRRATGIEGIGATLLDDHVAEHFSPVLEVKEYSVLWRNGAEPPVIP